MRSKWWTVLEIKNVGDVKHHFQGQEYVEWFRGQPFQQFPFVYQSEEDLKEVMRGCLISAVKGFKDELHTDG